MLTRWRTAPDPAAEQIEPGDCALITEGLERALDLVAICRHRDQPDP